MIQLSLPEYPAKVREKDGKQQIFDVIRRKYVTLTPEEWIRQHFVNFLITVKHFPKEILANEVSIKLHNTTKRCDTVAYNIYLEPLVIVEYKAPYIEINPTVLEQILRYNMALHAEYLIVSNGIRHICCRIDYQQQKYEFLREIPDYQQLSINKPRR